MTAARALELIPAKALSHCDPLPAVGSLLQKEKAIKAALAAAANDYASHASKFAQSAERAQQAGQKQKAQAQSQQGQQAAAGGGKQAKAKGKVRGGGSLSEFPAYQMRIALH